MALANVSDYQAAINKVFYYIDENFGGIDKYGFPVFAKIAPEDFKTLMTSYYAYKQTRQAASSIASAHTTSNTVGSNGVYFENGGSEQKATNPIWW